MTASANNVPDDWADVGTGDAGILGALRRLRLVGPEETPNLVRLTGGVSSDIYRVDRAGGPICVKRALPKLRVEEDWRAPIDRNQYEAEWMRVVMEAAPTAVPALLGEDREAGLFAMEYLQPDEYPLWKAQLLDGLADEETARQVGDTLASIHAATANDRRLADRFASDENFRLLRLDPYLGTAARRHPDVAGALDQLATTTARTKRVLVHGDVSPKNILVGPEGPVFLDAECAWYGEPAFDLAFCLNHLMLKGLWRPDIAGRYLGCFTSLYEAYLAGVTWEDQRGVEVRAAHLLPGLFLARVDGKSPVEYITEEIDKNHVREAAKALLHVPVDELSAVRDAWAREISE